MVGVAGDSGCCAKLVGSGDIRLLCNLRWMLVLNCCGDGIDSDVSADNVDESFVGAVSVEEWSAAAFLSKAVEPVGEWTVSAV